MMIGTTMQAAFEQGRQILSSDLPEVVTDIAGIKKDKTPTTKKLTFVATKNELLADSHCDIAWSDGLAIYAGENLQTCGPARFAALKNGEPETYGKARRLAMRPDHSSDRCNITNERTDW